MPLGVSYPIFPNETGKVFSSLPLRVMSIWCVVSSMVAIKESPVRKVDFVPAASMVTVVFAGQKSMGRHRSCWSVIQ